MFWRAFPTASPISSHPLSAPPPSSPPFWLQLSICFALTYSRYSSSHLCNHTILPIHPPPQGYFNYYAPPPPHAYYPPAPTKPSPSYPVYTKPQAPPAYYYPQPTKPTYYTKPAPPQYAPAPTYNTKPAPYYAPQPAAPTYNTHPAPAPAPAPEAVCGNAVREADEACDDGNVESGDGCNVNCFPEYGFTCTTPCAGSYHKGDICQKCGNGLVEGTEECDDSPDRCTACVAQSGSTCFADNTCTSALCGNKKIDGREECDDGNHISGDGECFDVGS